VRPLLVFDLFAGTGSSTQAFADAGHSVISFELDPSFPATETADVTALAAADLLARYGRPDFIWASPPCTSFSVASIGRNWTMIDGVPAAKTEAAEHGQRVVASTVALIAALSPRYGWLMENPRGMLRKLPVVAGLPRRTVTYCQYGDDRMKPTDLWGSVHGWEPRPPCVNGSPCHTPAPRGSSTGTQGIRLARDRSRVPYQLGEEIMRAISASAAMELGETV
jgi:hypothetical protein